MIARISLIIGCASLAIGNPLPQDINFALVDEAPVPSYTTTLSSVIYDASSVLQDALPQITSTIDLASVGTESVAPTIARRDTACQPQPTGVTGYSMSTDSPSAFANNPAFASAANNAGPVSGYTQTFINSNASSNAYGYMGYASLSSYDVQTCAGKCSKINGCMSFNIYFERDPSLNPAAACSNPSSVTNIKCVFWGGPINVQNTVNYGQYREQFQVLIAGSNGYQNNSIATPPGYSSPAYLGRAAINAPRDTYGFDTYMGSAIFTSGPFDISLCADACSAKSAYNLAHPPTDGSPVQTCQFFNTYILYINTTANLQGQYCAMYSESWAKSYATNNGQVRGSDNYLIEFSYSSANTTNPGIACHDCAVHEASQDITFATLQSLCSILLGFTIPTVTASVTVTSTPPIVVVSSTTAYTQTVTTTVVATAATTSTLNFRRRQDQSSSSAPVTPLIRLPSFATSAPASTEIAARALSTPKNLTPYPADVISSACALVATAPTVTTTVSVSTTTTIQTSTSTSVVSTTSTTFTTISSTTTRVALATATFKIQVVSDGKYYGYYASASGSGYTEELAVSQTSSTTFVLDANNRLMSPSGDMFADQDSGYTDAGQPIYWNPSSYNGVAVVTCQQHSGFLSCDSGSGRNILIACDAGVVGYSSSTPYLSLDRSVPSGCYAVQLKVILQ